MAEPTRLDRLLARDEDELRDDIRLASKFGYLVREISAARWAFLVNFHEDRRETDDFEGYFARRALLRRSEADKRKTANSKILSSAEAISAAVDALPIGRDIRQRLQARIAAHIDAIRSNAGGRA